MTPQAADRSCAAAIAGTRALVAEEAFGALVTLLVRMKAVPAHAAAAAMVDVAERLTSAGADHPVWRTSAAELELQAQWLRGIAANVLECSG